MRLFLGVLWPNSVGKLRKLEVWVRFQVMEFGGVDEKEIPCCELACL